MNLYTCTGFVGFQPTQTSAIILAETKEEAAKLLQACLEGRGLDQSIKPKQLANVDTSFPMAIILNDGDY